MTDEIRRVHVRVTQDHIDHGHPGTCHMCPVALALMAAGFDEASAGKVKLRAYEEIRGWFLVTWQCDTPTTVVAFIDQYDSAGEVHPFTFDVVMRRV